MKRSIIAALIVTVSTTGAVAQTVPPSPFDAIETLATSTERGFQEVDTDINRLSDRTRNGFDQVRDGFATVEKALRDASRDRAGIAAMSLLDWASDNALSVGVAVDPSTGEPGAALGASWRLSPRVSVRAATSFNRSGVAFIGAGFTVRIGE